MIDWLEYSTRIELFYFNNITHKALIKWFYTI